MARDDSTGRYHRTRVLRPAHAQSPGLAEQDVFSGSGLEGNEGEAHCQPRHLCRLFLERTQVQLMPCRNQLLPTPLLRQTSAGART